MKVYVVLRHYDYECDDLVCVCGSEELAKSKVLEYNKGLESWKSLEYRYEECVVEET